MEGLLTENTVIVNTGIIIRTPLPQKVRGQGHLLEVLLIAFTPPIALIFDKVCQCVFGKSMRSAPNCRVSDNCKQMADTLPVPANAIDIALGKSM